MIRITATSKTKFKQSGKTEPSKREIFKAWVWSKGLNVRDWAGDKHNPCSFSPLSQGAIVGVCDAILSADGKNWYYIKIGTKYGFINAKYVKGVPQITLRFLHHLEVMHTYVKHNGSKFKYYFDKNLTTFQKAKNYIAKGGIAGITCVVPCRWALKAVGIDPSGFWGKDATFKHCYKGVIKDHFKRVTEGGAVGMTVKQAVDKGVFPIGAICAFKGRTHTFVYSGDRYYVYDGGHAAIKDGKYTGVKVDYSVKNKNCIISEYLVWKG